MEQNIFKGYNHRILVLDHRFNIRLHSKTELVMFIYVHLKPIEVYVHNLS